MAHEEIFNTRDRSYSAWHRRASLARFISIEEAQTAHMIDLDASVWIEFDEVTKRPLLLAETAMDRGQNFKPATVTKELAKMANLPACVLLYMRGDELNPADTAWFDITQFRFRRIYPDPETKGWEILTPKEWAEKLMAIRRWSADQLKSQYCVLKLSDEPVRRVVSEICSMAERDKSRLIDTLERELGWCVKIDEEVAA